MFKLLENSEKAIKIIAKIQLLIFAVFGLILPLVLKVYDGSFFVGLLIHLMFTFLSIFIGFFNAVFIYAFGELVDNSKTSTDILKNINNRLNKLEALNNNSIINEIKDIINK